MKVFTYSEARQNLSNLLIMAQNEEIVIMAQNEEIEIRRKDGAVFSLKAKKRKAKSHFDVPGIKTKATTQDIVDAVRGSRMG